MKVCQWTVYMLHQTQVDTQPTHRACAASPGGAGAGCPPHPGFMGGICIRCGALKDEAEEQGVALSYIHRGLEVSKHEAERVRQVGRQGWRSAAVAAGIEWERWAAASAGRWTTLCHCQALHCTLLSSARCSFNPALPPASPLLPRQGTADRLLAGRKLLLILDLDHTLLNSTRFIEVPPESERRDGSAGSTLRMKGGLRWTLKLMLGMLHFLCATCVWGLPGCAARLLPTAPSHARCRHPPPPPQPMPCCGRSWRRSRWTLPCCTACRTCACGPSCGRGCDSSWRQPGSGEGRAARRLCGE